MSQINLHENSSQHPSSENDKTNGILDRFRNFALSTSEWTQKWVPDAWIIAVILSIIVFLMTISFGNASPVKAAQVWGKGLWVLLPLMAQFSFAIIVAYVCATAPATKKALNWLGSRPDPDKPWQATLLVAVVSLLTGYINWALTVVVSAIFVPFVAKHNPKSDMRLLVAAAYVGIATLWHAGLSGSATLLVATPENFLLKDNILTDLIPVTRTIFSQFNILLVLVTIVTTALILTLLTPKKSQVKMDQSVLDSITKENDFQRPANLSPADRMAWWPGWNIILGVASLYFLINIFTSKGIAGWSIDTYNLLFLTLALFLTWRPIVFLEGCKKGVQGAWGILVQFPLYGGIFGLISYTDLGHVLTTFFTSISTPQTFLPIVYWYSGILGYFVPSGGSKWIIEAPYLLKAAKELGISPASTTLAYSWGDMMSHLIQPFWAIALLDITKTKFGQIAGFCTMLLLVYIIITSIAMFLMPIHL
ncbi:TIGR00366 family protein [Thermoflavimicrobium dichotomicum]|uniref:Short-chain fatty acids transporter n=1 Tax=Thermoflavimicrobium dichotomicum TaxID=46223 RepID=A0A1I3TAF1_9BACL|nr:TIGR00366 family protein [Thermoflavimicrobium dichotomicum]SFJ66636.1 short-chain fatty acids transporter [Thermoflavimicrobium dichotomicum]